MTLTIDALAPVRPMAKPSADMQLVLDALEELGPLPIEELSPSEARAQPSPADAVKMVLQKQGRLTAPDASVVSRDVEFRGAAGKLAARIYTPSGARAPLPIVLYIHGGGWVIADLDTYDASPRTIAKLVNAIVVSIHYRQGPEHKFPAAHDDACAAYLWLLNDATNLGGDPSKIAVMGESAGANLALNVAIYARDHLQQAPLHQVLIYPVAGVEMETESYKENAAAKPLSKSMMAWFMKNFLSSERDLEDPRMDLVGRANLANLPGATVITAEIDPLRSEGQALAARMRTAGADVRATTYEGVTHEFFGMGAAVSGARDAENLVAARLKAAFA